MFFFFVFFGLVGHGSLPPFSCLVSLLAFFFFNFNELQLIFRVLDYM